MAEVELPDPEELEERRDTAFSRRVALTTAIDAVVLAIASLGGNNAMKEMLLAQQEATNQWAYYQAKVVREHLNRGNKVVFEAHLAEPSNLKGAERAKYEALARRFADEEKRMVAIVTSSVSILATSRPMYGFSMALAVLGALLTLNGFTLLVKIPMLHGH